MGKGVWFSKITEGLGPFFTKKGSYCWSESSKLLRGFHNFWSKLSLETQTFSFFDPIFVWKRGGALILVVFYFFFLFLNFFFVFKPIFWNWNEREIFLQKNCFCSIKHQKRWRKRYPERAVGVFKKHLVDYVYGSCFRVIWPKNNYKKIKEVHHN